MHRIQCLVITPAVSLVRYDHAPGVDHCDDSEEECSTPAINFVESGSFELEIETKSWRLAPVSVTATCYESGFANLSHFIRSFRRWFRYLPSAVKKQSK